MEFDGLTVAYTDKFLDWQLGEEHPVNPLRATVALQQLRDEHGKAVRVLTNWANASYIEREKWLVAAAGTGASPDQLNSSELTMFGATYTLVEQLMRERLADKLGIYFNPSGGESAAHLDVEVFNDADWAARRLTGAGLRVAYVDLDAHGAAELGADEVLSYSVEQAAAAAGGATDAGTVQPGRWQLGAGATDIGLVQSVQAIVDEFPEQLDVLILNAGADGLADDESSELSYTLEGLVAAASLLGMAAAARKSSILVLGGGGQLPLDDTPTAWTNILAALGFAMRSLSLS